MTSATGSAERVAAYIDGFNLYHGIHEDGRRHLWLDLEGLVLSLLKPGQKLLIVRYFTARVRNNPDSEQRQNMYLKALAAYGRTQPPVRYGADRVRGQRHDPCHPGTASVQA